MKVNKKYLIFGGLAVLGGLMLFGGNKTTNLTYSDTAGPGLDIDSNNPCAKLKANIPLGATRAKKIADDLHQVMKGNWKLNAEEELQVVLLLCNLQETHFSEVRKAFGTKSYNTLTNNQSFPIWTSNPPLLNLPSWLKNEMSAFKYAQLKTQFPKNL